MIRTRIQLKEDQMRRLKELSVSCNESVASLIRRAIDKYLATVEPDKILLYRQALSIAGKYETPESDISVEHDRYLDEAFGS